MDVKFLFYSLLFIELGFLCKSDENSDKNDNDQLIKSDLKNKPHRYSINDIENVWKDLEKKITVDGSNKEIQLPEQIKNLIKRSKDDKKNKNTKNKKTKNKKKNKKNKKKKGKKRKLVQKGVKQAIKNKRKNRKKNG